MDKQEYQARVAWLRRYRQAVQEERSLLERIAETRARAESTTHALLGSSSRRSKGSDKIAAAVSMILQYQTQLAEKVQKSEEIRIDIETAIEQLDNPMQRQVLYLRYIDGLPRWKVAHEMYISEEWVKKLHRYGVQNLGRVPASTPFL